MAQNLRRRMRFVRARRSEASEYSQGGVTGADVVADGVEGTPEPSELSDDAGGELCRELRPELVGSGLQRRVLDCDSRLPHEQRLVQPAAEVDLGLHAVSLVAPHPGLRGGHLLSPAETD